MPTLSSRKRQSIVDAAIREFQANGFLNTSMDTIAASAQVSKRTVYNHFPSKVDLFNSIVELVWLSANQVAPTIYDADRPVREQLQFIASEELALVSDPAFQGMVKMLMTEFMSNHSLAEETLSKLNQEESMLTKWFKQAGDLGQLQIEDAEAAAKHFYSLIKSLALWPQILMGQPSIPASQHELLASQVCTMFLALYQPMDSPK